MKKLLLSLLLALSVTFGFAQTKKDLFIGVSARTNVVTSPLSGDVQAEVGYNAGPVSLAVVGLTDSKFRTDKVAALGLRGYVKLFEVSNLQVKAGAEALKLYKAPKANGKSAFTGLLSLNAPLTNNIDARISGLAVYHREQTRKSDIWKFCDPGLEFTLILHPFRK